MAQRATDDEVLRILISIGPTETMHFQTWSDKAGNAPPLTAIDPVTGVSVTFPDLSNAGEHLNKSLIMWVWYNVLGRYCPSGVETSVPDGGVNSNIDAGTAPRV